MGICLKKKDNNKSSYYKDLRYTIKKFYDKNHYNSFNLAYSLHTNKFATRRTSTKLFYDDSNNNDIIWKDYLLQKFEPSPKDLDWKKSFYNFISKEPFSNQYMFQNKIFFEEFAFLTKPKLNKKEDSFLSLTSEPILSSLDTKELKSLSRNVSSHLLNTNTNENDINNLNFNNNIDNIDINSDYEQHLNLNITIESITSSMINKDPKYEAQLNSYKIKLYIQIIKKHLDNKYHPLNIIINKFIDFFTPYLMSSSYYCERIKNDKNECMRKGKEIVKQIQNFIETMQVVLKLFYSKSINYRYFIDEKDEIINLLTYIVFNIPKIYKSLSKIFSYMNNEKIEKLRSQFQKLGELTPKDFGISAKFCLDKNTDEFMKELKNNNKNNANKDNINNNGEKTNEIKKKSSKISRLVEAIGSQKKENNKLEQDIKNIDIDNDIDIENIFDSNKMDIISIHTEKTTKQNNNKNIYKLNNNKLQYFDEDDNMKITKLEKLRDTIDSYQDKMNIKQLLITSLENECFPSLPKMPRLSKSREPYFDAIEYLRQIDTYRVPLEKLTIVALISVIITDCIDQYWEPMKNEITPKLLNIDADELISIYLYIIYKLKMHSLFVHLDFIRYFTTQISKQSMIGYYFTAVEGCLNYILKAEDKKAFLKN